MNPFDLAGKVAIVTGGNGGIGFGIASALAEAGAKVAVAGRNSEKCDRAVQAIRDSGGEAISVLVDVTKREQVDAMIARTVSEFGGLSLLVANAGTNVRKLPQDYSAEEWQLITDTNLTSVFTCCQAVYPELKKQGGGKIVTIGSMTSIFGFDVAPIYAATKGGVMQLSRSLASAWARDNIQVNCILPGWIDSDLTRMARQVVPGLQERVVERTPARRWGKPADLGNVAVFFCSAASDFVTGTALPVDGGFSSSMF